VVTGQAVAKINLDLDPSLVLVVELQGRALVVDVIQTPVAVDLVAGLEVLHVLAEVVVELEVHLREIGPLAVAVSQGLGGNLFKCRNVLCIHKFSTLCDNWKILLCYIL
jgi:hypothetical protein